ncbi:MAG: roadblock/LC7 domain-containing protein [Burkholderiaceae bacterium]|nr:MAG: roadblock/LC7 domain-containing protein [Burkholderiaceae bacterium]
MKSRYLRHKLSALAQVRGVTSCVLVDADSGLIWERSETMDLPEHGAELMIDFWRLYQRAGGAFRTLGPLRAIGLQHEKRNVHVMECVAGVLLVVTSIVGIPVDEATLAQKALELGQLVER